MTPTTVTEISVFAAFLVANRIRRSGLESVPQQRYSHARLRRLTDLSRGEEIGGIEQRAEVGQ
jgi:hypothetical protein